jgi:acetyl-CoA C-acetyltransferase
VRLRAWAILGDPIMLGDADILISGGAVMSRYANLAALWRARLGDTKLIDMVVGAARPFRTFHMGVAEQHRRQVGHPRRAGRWPSETLTALKTIGTGYFKDRSLGRAESL